MGPHGAALADWDGKKGSGSCSAKTGPLQTATLTICVGTAADSSLGLEALVT